MMNSHKPRRILYKIVGLSLLHLVFISPLTVSANADNISTVISCDAEDNSLTITPFADITGWRYKTINGRIHKRLYNYSKQKWIGEWQPC